MKEAGDLKEYVLNESGLAFKGSFGNMETIPWDYAQVRGVDSFALNSAVYLF